MKRPFINKEEAEQKMNQLDSEGKDFFFLIDYRFSKCLVCHPDEASKMGIYYQFPNGSNTTGAIKNQVYTNEMVTDPLIFTPPSRKKYKEAFDQVMREIKGGNTYLINLCFESDLPNFPGLNSIFQNTKGKYKILMEEEFVVFSPETFVKIENGRVSAYPMKGTISASVPSAEKKLMEDPKELAEHFTIVDLLRNDLSIVAKNVEVNKFRYAENIQSGSQSLIQTSSEISGRLTDEYLHKPGSVIFAMLPAGSITGAPKKKTVEILNRVESLQRNFYTGVAGLYKDKNLDSAVMIRFIEKRGDRYFFKSGGGITCRSAAEKEYRELMEKIYVPTS